MVFNNPEGFENGFGDWSVDHTVWEIGAPTFANGPQPRSGSGVAGTILAGNYVNNNGASLISPRFLVPPAATNPRLSYWDWHDTDPQDSGVVQMSVNGGAWQNLGLSTAAAAANPREWKQQSVGLQPYAGQQVRLRFYFFARNGSPAAGWYIDDVQITSDSLDPIADQTIQEGTEFRLAAVARGDGTVFRLGPNAPSGATIDPNTGVFRWTPAEDQGPGDFRGVTIEVTNPDGAITPLQRQAFNITVTEVNQAPTLSVPTAKVSDEQVLWSQSVTATDPDLPANRITYSLVASLSGMTINAQTGVLTWTPDESKGPTENVIRVVATDDGTPPLSTTNVFDLAVREVNTAPSLAALADASVLIGAPFTLQASAVDIDLPANSLSFGLEIAPAGMVIDPATGRIAWTPGQTQVGEHSVVVRVADGGAPVFHATRAFKVIVQASELRLALQPLAAGLKRIRISGDLGLSYDLQSSTNLVDWQRLAEFRLNSSPFSYIDPDSPDVPVRFYRVLLKSP